MTWHHVSVLWWASGAGVPHVRAALFRASTGAACGRAKKPIIPVARRDARDDGDTFAGRAGALLVLTQAAGWAVNEWFATIRCLKATAKNDSSVDSLDALASSTVGYVLQTAYTSCRQLKRL